MLRGTTTGGYFSKHIATCNAAKLDPFSHCSYWAKMCLFIRHIMQYKWFNFWNNYSDISSMVMGNKIADLQIDASCETAE